MRLRRETEWASAHTAGHLRVRSRAWCGRCSLLVQGPVSSAGSGLSGSMLRVGLGGACGRLLVRVVCARAPSLTSVRNPRVGSGAGDMMCDGVIPLGEALRPLDLSGPSTRTCRQQQFGSRPRRISVSEDLARGADLLRWLGVCRLYAGLVAGVGCHAAEPEPPGQAARASVGS